MNSWVDWFSGPFAQACWQIVALVACLSIAQIVLGRRVAPRTFHLLWWLVALRAFLPFVPHGAWQAAGLTWTRIAESEAPSVELRAVAPFTTSVRPTLRPERPADGLEATELDTPEPQIETQRAPVAIARPTPAVRPPTTEGLPQSKSRAVESNGSDAPRILLVLVWLWALGVFGCAARLLLLECLSRKRLENAERVLDEALLSVLREAAQDAGVVRLPDLLFTREIRAPALVGFVRPRILLPAELVREASPEDVRHVLLHELFHLRARDVWWNASLCLLDVLYWFHPVLRIALRRLRAQREIVRDWQALAATERDDPRSYAGTLVHLLERTPRLPRARASVAWLDDLHDLRNRIMWILRFDARRTTRSPFPLLVTASAAVLVLALAAPTISRAGTERSSLDVQDPEHIRVTRQESTPTWKAEIQRRLAQTKLTLHLEEMEPLEVFDLIARECEVSIIPDRSGREELGSRDAVTLNVEAIPAEKVLDHLTKDLDVLWAIARGCVVLTADYGRYDLSEVRLYDVSPLLERVDEMDAIQDLIYEFVADPNTWDYDIRQPWGNQLLVRTRARVHDELESFLDRLLARGKGEHDPPAWRAELEARLEPPMDVSYEDADISLVVDSLQKAGLPIRLHGDALDSADVITFSAQGMRIRDVLTWIADLSGLRVAYRDGQILLTTNEPLSLRVYAIGDLFEETQGTYGEGDAVFEVLRQALPMESWDEEGRLLQTWDGLLLVRQSETAHDQILNVLDTLRRARAH